MTQAIGMAPGISMLYVYVGNTDTAIISAMTVTTDAPLSKQIRARGAGRRRIQLAQRLLGDDGRAGPELLRRVR